MQDIAATFTEITQSLYTYGDLYTHERGVSMLFEIHTHALPRNGSDFGRCVRPLNIDQLKALQELVIQIAGRILCHSSDSPCKSMR